MPAIGMSHSLDCICRLCEEREAISRKLELERKAEMFDKLVEALEACVVVMDVYGADTTAGAFYARDTLKLAKGGAVS